MGSSFFSSPLHSGFKQLKVAIVGGGIGGLSAAIALRRAGHIGSSSRPPTLGDVSENLALVVEIFERRGFDVEVGASLSCGANGRLRVHHQCSVLSVTHLFSFKVPDGSESGGSTFQ